MSTQTLKLTLHREPFELILSGEKKKEFRNDSTSGWMRKKLFKPDGSSKHFNFVEFTNGYGRTRPWMKVEYKGFQEVTCVFKRYSTGLTININNKNTFVIQLGKVVATRNIEKLNL